MGLDMYLEKAKKQEGKTFEEITKRLNDLSYEEWGKSRSEIMYWRKANQIHNWFVINIQNEVDDCGNYEVTKEALETLLEQCKLVKEEFTKAKKVEGMVKNGSTWKRETGHWEIVETIEGLEKVLEETDFENYHVWYNSSW